MASDGYQGIIQAESSRWQAMLPATIEGVEVVAAAIEELLESADCPLKSQLQISVAVDEVLANIVSYAYKPGEGPMWIDARVETDPEAVAITFADEGVPFNPLSIPEPDTSLPLEQRKEGGMGIMIVRKTMSEVTYVYENGRNVLTIRKEF